MNMHKLLDICDFQGGTQPPKEEWIDTPSDGYIRMLQIRDYSQGDEKFIQYVKDTPNLHTCKEDDIMLSRYGYIGQAFTGLTGAYNVALVKVIKKKEIDTRYLFYYFQSEYFQRSLLSNVGSRATIPGFNKTELKNTTIPVPNGEEQYIIAERLSKIDELIEKRSQQLNILDELIKSRFIEMFGMPGTDEFGWGLTPLGCICHINPKKGQDTRLSSGVEVSFVPMPAVTECGEIDATAVRKYDEVKTGFTYFAENDVLFAKITPCMENGKGAVARGLHNGIGFGSTEFHVLRPISGKSNPCWIYTLTAFSQFREDAASNMTGSAGQRRVPASFLENYRVAVPPIELQEQFAAFVAQVDKSKFCIRKTLHVCRKWWTKMLDGAIMSMEFCTQRRRNK